MKWIGLTGGIASGKSTVAKILTGAGIPVLDADEAAYFVSKKDSPGLAQIVQHFGSQILNSQGELDRKAMAAQVFSDKRKLLELEGILHPLIKEEIQKRKKELEAQGVALAFYDVPLLFEKKMEKDFDEIVLVTSTRDLQISRMQFRNGLSLEEAEARLANQIPLAEKEIHSTRVIKNHGSFAELEKETLEVLKKIQSAKP